MLSFVLLPRCCAFGLCCLDVLGGVNHARVGLGLPRCGLGRPRGQCVEGAGRLAPGLAHLYPSGLGLLGRGPVLGTGFALAEPASAGEPSTGGSLVLDGGEVGGPILLGLDGERPGDLGAYLCGGFFGLAEHGGALVILDPMRGTLGVEAGGDLLPPFRCLFGPLGLVVKAGEFFGDEPDGAVCDGLGR